MLFNDLERLVAFINKIIEFKKVPGGVSANTLFRKYDEVSSFLLCLVDAFYDLACIVFKIANMIVLLREFDFHDANLRCVAGSISYLRAQQFKTRFVIHSYEKDRPFPPHRHCTFFLY